MGVIGKKMEEKKELIYKELYTLIREVKLRLQFTITRHIIIKH